MDWDTDPLKKSRKAMHLHVSSLVRDPHLRHPFCLASCQCNIEFHQGLAFSALAK